MLKEMDVTCCNCNFIYGPKVVQLQQKSDGAKSKSSRILDVKIFESCIRQKINIHPSNLWVMFVYTKLLTHSTLLMFNFNIRSCTVTQNRIVQPCNTVREMLLNIDKTYQTTQGYYPPLS